MVSDEALKKLQEQIAAWPMTQRFVVQQLIRDYLRDREAVRAYEATGLTPERCAEFARADAEGRYIVMRDAEQEGVARLRELSEADKDGRVVVLPCKVGQRVFALLDTDKHLSECEVKQIGLGNEIGFVGIEPIGARGREYGVSINGFGKTVANNLEVTVKIKVIDTEKTLHEWADFLGINPYTLYDRLRAGWPPERALFERVSLNKYEHQKKALEAMKDE